MDLAVFFTVTILILWFLPTGRVCWIESFRRSGHHFSSDTYLDNAVMVLIHLLNDIDLNSSLSQHIAARQHGVRAIIYSHWKVERLATSILSILLLLLFIWDVGIWLHLLIGRVSLLGGFPWRRYMLWPWSFHRWATFKPVILAITIVLSFISLS